MANAEEELPEELDKLQISPNQASTSKNLPLGHNPFFENGGNIISTVIDVSGSGSSPMGINCASSRRKGLRQRRASESVLDERKNCQSSNADEDECLRTPSTSGVLKQSLKKYGSSSTGLPGHRKLVLREPILRALQSCFRPHSSVRQSIVGNYSEIQVLNLSKHNNTSAVSAAKGINDFRDLIHECHCLLTEEVEFSSGHLKKLSPCLQSSKNFTTLQASKSTTNTSGKFSNNRKTYHNEQNILESQAKCSGGLSDCEISIHINQKSAPTLPRNSFSASSSPEHATSARCSTTCSQQAGTTVAAGACDDVTIDELASYFDTFVHIPKKMSSMAEMMYI